MALTNEQKTKKYEFVWSLVDEAVRELTPIHAEEDISDLMGRLQMLKDKVEEKTSVLQEFDPN